MSASGRSNWAKHVTGKLCDDAVTGETWIKYWEKTFTRPEKCCVYGCTCPVHEGAHVYKSTESNRSWVTTKNRKQVFIVPTCRGHNPGGIKHVFRVKDGTAYLAITDEDVREARKYVNKLGGGSEFPCKSCCNYCPLGKGKKKPMSSIPAAFIK